MIRPVSMARPCFTARTIMGGENETKKTENNEKQADTHTRGLTKGEKNIFLAGAFVGAVMGIGGTYLNNNIQTRNMLEDMKMELDASHDKDLIIEDRTGDKIPEIILEDMNGDVVYYDFMKHNAYLKIGDETVDKLQ